jgi:hypothetical protein
LICATIEVQFTQASFGSSLGLGKASLFLSLAALGTGGQEAECVPMAMVVFFK